MRTLQNEKLGIEAVEIFARSTQNWFYGSLMLVSISLIAIKSGQDATRN